MQSLNICYPITASDTQAKMTPQVLAIGDFDGVHLGHQEVIKRAMYNGKRLNIPASIMTFHPHPREVLGQQKYTSLLTPVEQKKRMLQHIGIDHMYIVSFDADFMKVTPEEFVENMLIPMQVNTVIVGFDFTFGYLGAGTPDTLCDLAHGRFAVEIIRPFQRNGSKVSSTLVREHLLEGQIDEANALLGRPYSVVGTIVTGDGRGKTIGFPTANVQLHEPYVTPAIGVYAVRATVEGQAYHGVMNLGRKPTFVDNLEKPTLEVHLFDFSGDIYGKEMTIEFISYLRPERKFTSVDELITQIHQDADTAKALLKEMFK